MVHEESAGESHLDWRGKGRGSLWSIARIKPRRKWRCVQLQAVGADCVAVETDITQPARAEQLVKTVADRYGRIDVLVNNVGDFRWGTLAESPVDEWTSIFDSNVTTVFYMCRAALPLMRKGRWGRIINLGAVGAERAFGQAKISAYAAAKAAVVAMSRSLALEEAKNGITVNVVNPSSIDEKDLTLEEAQKTQGCALSHRSASHGGRCRGRGFVFCLGRGRIRHRPGCERERRLDALSLPGN